MAILVGSLFPASSVLGGEPDRIREIQTDAVLKGVSPIAYWGADPANYTAWGSHSNRLIPVYTFGTRGGGAGVDLKSYLGRNSAYRSQTALEKIYGKLPSHTLNPEADYGDQTNLADLQWAAVAAGKKHVFLVVFDGMDWQTTRAAALYATGRVGYHAGCGSGLHIQNYSADGTSQFGFVVTSPQLSGIKSDPDKQVLLNPGSGAPGGYNAQKAGPNPWTPGADAYYLIGRNTENTQPGEHVYADSAGTATALCTGVKTYNGAICVAANGEKTSSIAHGLQSQGWAVGAISSVPISHATPAAAYAQNVSRHDYQDLTRDMLGLVSASHPDHPLPGLDVLLGGGWGVDKKTDPGQGGNFIPGNRYITPIDLRAVDTRVGGKYVVVQREPERNGANALASATTQAVKSDSRLLGVFGVAAYGGHLPFQTANGDYQPAPGRSKKAEEYSPADIAENPTLAQMTTAAITVLNHRAKQRKSNKFWLMVEAGDVDWANHDNNLDNSIGAVLSGDDAVRVITDWVEANSNWHDSLLIVTADHGHFLHILDPAAIASASPEAKKTAAK